MLSKIFPQSFKLLSHLINLNPCKFYDGNLIPLGYLNCINSFDLLIENLKARTRIPILNSFNFQDKYSHYYPLNDDLILLEREFIKEDYKYNSEFLLLYKARPILKINNKKVEVIESNDYTKVFLSLGEILSQSIIILSSDYFYNLKQLNTSKSSLIVLNTSSLNESDFLYRDTFRQRNSLEVTIYPFTKSSVNSFKNKELSRAIRDSIKNHIKELQSLSLILSPYLYEDEFFNKDFKHKCINVETVIEQSYPFNNSNLDKFKRNYKGELILYVNIDLSSKCSFFSIPGFDWVNLDNLINLNIVLKQLYEKNSSDTYFLNGLLLVKLPFFNFESFSEGEQELLLIKAISLLNRLNCN